MHTFRRHVAAPPERVWALIAQPDQWARWAPHIRGARGLGSPEVRPGARGAVRLLGLPVVPARITAKEPGRSWTWQVGPVTLCHRVERAPGGALAAIELSAPGPLEPALALTYGPVVGLVLRNLARVAARPGCH